jgi:hypothetical protein
LPSVTYALICLVGLAATAKAMGYTWDDMAICFGTKAQAMETSFEGFKSEASMWVAKH